MKLIVEITDDNWKAIQDGTWCGSEEIAKGTPLEPCSDAISRSDVINSIEPWLLSGEWRYLNATAYLKKRIMRLPSVHAETQDMEEYSDKLWKLAYERGKREAEPRTGHWIFCKGDGRACVDGHICSVCKTSYHTQVPYFAEYKYCPNCGAKMEV